MKSRIPVGLVTLFSLVFFLQPVFGDDFFYRAPNRASFVAQVHIGGAAYQGSGLARLWI